MALLVAAVVVAASTVACSSGDESGPTTAATTERSSPTSTRRTSTTVPSAARRFATGLPRHSHLGPAGTATMHGDSASSDTTPLVGPGTGTVQVASIPLGAVCPSVLVGTDGLPVALCTRISDLRPMVFLLDPAGGPPLASIEITAGSLFGGVYDYLDDADRAVLVDGDGMLLRIGHHRVDAGWELTVDERVVLGSAISPGDAVTSVAPDYHGEVWFATGAATVGLVDTDTATVRTVALGAGERVSNSISVAPAGMTVATDHAVYLLARGPDGRPVLRWRAAYDRGSARKPGQLSWGTGSTPTFFGPTDGADYVAFVDNADDRAHLVVVRASGRQAGRTVCSVPVLAEGGPGSENSPIGAGRTVVVASTYGYPYPRLPDDAGPSRPETAPFVGGMTRVDVDADESGCTVIWDNAVRSAAVPKLSTADGSITTMTSSPGGGFAYAVIDAGTGEVLTEQPLGPGVADPLQMAGTVGEGPVLYQGTVGSILRIT